GAHYDHLGYGGQGSMRPDVRAIHNGADDNASGTAAMVCAMARLAKAELGEDRRTIVGLAFTAEEIGLGGSAFYADNPVFPHERTTAMVNLDMVGRVRDGALQALGADTAPEWREILAPIGETHGLSLAMGGDGYGPSDHTSFYEKKLPVIHLFSGTHDIYHTPDDDIETLNLEGGAAVTGLLVDLTEVLATRPDRLTYVRSSAGPRMAGDSRSRGAYLGTIPDMSAMTLSEGGEGVLLSDVRSEGPADRAGMRGGDVIVEMAGVEIQNLYDMTFVLRDHRPGQTIDIAVLRDGKRVELKATLGSRAGAKSPLQATPGSAAADADAVRWHMIGHLQRNKARKVVDHCRLIHSVDSLRLAEELQSLSVKAERDIEVLVQVNCTGEEQKYGCPIAATSALVEQIDSMAYVQCRGLMTMAAYSPDPENSRAAFARCRELFTELRDDGAGEGRFNILSMGMSGDFEVGIEEGANIVRVGSAIFGERKTDEA
ncbi:MAG: YggS family pyridoxal phosphate-dependent enzyme, partial [Planctomycetota bacterium]